MMDKSIPYIGVIMIKDDPLAYPRHALPEGYRFRLYEDGMERDWAAVETSAGEFDTADAARAHFAQEFLAFPRELGQRMVFVQDPRGRAAGTATLWRGNHFGEERQRVHWVAVHPDHQGRGIAKAMMTRVMDLYHALGCRDPLYLTTQTWSYPAVSIYLAFGFRPYRGEKPANWKPAGGSFEDDNAAAWALIMDRLGRRKRRAEADFPPSPAGDGWDGGGSR